MNNTFWGFLQNNIRGTVSRVLTLQSSFLSQITMEVHGWEYWHAGSERRTEQPSVLKKVCQVASSSNKEEHCDYGCYRSVVERGVLITAQHVLLGEDAGTAQCWATLWKAILLFPPANMLNRLTFLVNIYITNDHSRVYDGCWGTTLPSNK